MIPDRSKSIAEGAIVPWSRNLGSGRYPSMNPYYMQQLERVLRRYRVKTTTPVEKLSDEVLDLILYGTDREQTFAYTSRGGKTWEYRASFEGVVNNLQRRYSETSSDYVKEEIEKFMSASVCPACKGARLKPEALAVTIGERNIDELTRMSIEQLELFFRSLALTPRQEQIAHQIVKEIRSAPRLPHQRGLELPDARAFGDDARRRRVAAHSPRDADRQRAGRRALHLRRAVDRIASAR